MDNKSQPDYETISAINRKSDTLAPWHQTPPKSDVTLNCGWGRVIFAHTFKDPKLVAQTLMDEESGERDIAFYVQDPHVILAHAPQSLFLDPSHAYRLDFTDYEDDSGFEKPPNVEIRLLCPDDDLNEVNGIYQQHRMMPFRRDVTKAWRNDDRLCLIIAIDQQTRRIIGSVMGIDHKITFNDPENGSSLWALAVSKFCSTKGVGEGLIRALVNFYKERGRSYLDLSVMHDNAGAIALYEKLNFKRIPVFCVKHKNTINHPLFTQSTDQAHKLNPYAKIIYDEALRRGIMIDIKDASRGFMKLKFAGRSINCIESLTDLTTAIAFQICSDKFLCWQLLERKGIRLPKQVVNPTNADVQTFLEAYKNVVVKPTTGEQGKLVFVGLTSVAAVNEACEMIRADGGQPILQQQIQGMDMRIIVIGGEFVAAALRRPPTVYGDGQHSIEQLITQLDRRRRAATGGESRIPLDEETKRSLALHGYTLSDVPAPGKTIQVRMTANLHTGGSIEDVTDLIHDELKELAASCAQILNIPVVGLDFMVATAKGDRPYFIEANERPGLANHEPQPVVERFVDLLFPESKIE